MSLEILREPLTSYQKAVKEAKCRYLSNIASFNSSSPRVLFNRTQSVVSPAGSSLKDVSEAMCNRLLNVFMDKVASVRTSIGYRTHDVDIYTTPSPPAVLKEPVTLSVLSVWEMRHINCPLDIIPSKVHNRILTLWVAVQSPWCPQFWTRL